MEDIQMYAKLFPAIKDTGVLATGAADLQTAMGGRAGTQREIVSRALMAAQGTEESPEELLKATGKSAAFFRGIGARPEEITSAIAVLSDVAGGPMGAARWMKTLGPEITKATPLLRGQGLAAALSDKASIELSKKLTGTSLEAYQILRENQPQIEEMNQRQRWAEQTDYVGQLTSTIEGVPEIRAERLRRSQAAKKALAMTDEGTMRSVSLAAADARTTQMKERGSPGLARWGEKQLSDFERYSAVDEMYLNREMVTGRQPGIAQRLFNITHNWGVAGMYAAQPPRDDLGKDLLKVMDRIEKNTRTTKVNAPVIRVDVE
jgi:alkylhydroperoxidase/carboxymuconolactone decarboxylase family protein YurZ